jgi:hypothetical protein
LCLFVEKRVGNKGERKEGKGEDSGNARADT